LKYDIINAKDVKHLKKFGIILLILVLLIGGFFGYKFVTGKIEAARIAKIKEGWYVEVDTEALKIRKEADRNTAELYEAKKGEVFAVTEYENNNGNMWYYVEYEKGKYGWIANPRNSNYLIDGNNPNDIRKPTIKFFDSVYYVDSIDDITYDHLEVTDDKEGVVVTHKVYHEVDEAMGKDQYWIQYTATDAVGKTATKVQKIEFNKRPDESKVEDFSKLKR